MLALRKMDVQQRIELTTEAYKAAPPVTVAAGYSVLGLPLADLVAIATIAYIVLQAAFLIWKWRRMAKDKAATDGDD